MCKKKKMTKVFPFSHLLKNYFLIEVMYLMYRLNRIKNCRTVRTSPQSFGNAELSPFKRQVQSPYYSMSGMIFGSLQRIGSAETSGDPPPCPRPAEYTDQLQDNSRVEA